MTTIPYFDIFISYTSKSSASNTSQIQKLYKRLTEDYNFKVWLDLEQLNLDNISKTIAEGIRNSKLIICCVTKFYSQSTIQQSELELVSELKKPLVIIMLEDLKLMDVSEISMHIGHLRRCNLFSDYRGLKSWSGKIFDDIIQKIKQVLEIYEKKFKPQINERKAPASVSLTSSNLQKHDFSFLISLPKSTKHIVTKYLDLFRLKNYEKLSNEVEHKGLIMHQNDLNSLIDSLLVDYSDLSEYERQPLVEVKSLNLNEQRIFYLDKFENGYYKISLFIFKRKYNGRYQVYSCATKRFHDLTKFHQILTNLYSLDYKKHTLEFLEEVKTISNRSISKVFLINYLIEEMASYYDQNIAIDWDKDFKLYPNESTIPFQKPKISSTDECIKQKTTIDESKIKKNEVNFLIKLPISSQAVVTKCIELSENRKMDTSSQIMKFEKFIIEANNMENFISVLLAKYPHVTDDEKRNMYKLKNLSLNEARVIFIETFNVDASVKLTLLITKFNSNGQFKILSCETKNFLRILDITEIFTYFYRIKECQQTIELYQNLEAIQSNKRINKNLIKYFLIEQFKLHFNESVEIQWEQPVEVKVPINCENQIVGKEDFVVLKTHDKVFENKINVENQINLEDLNKPLVQLKLPADGEYFIDICQNFIKKNNLEAKYNQFDYKTANIKLTFINKYIDKMLDDYFYANDYEKDSIVGMKNLKEGEKKSLFIETSTHDSSKFTLIICTRQSSSKYQFVTCEDLEYHDLSEFKNIFIKFYGDESKRILFDEFIDTFYTLTNKLNSKIFILNFMIRKLNENFNENLTIEWISLNI
jgi:hypothetical protein